MRDLFLTSLKSMNQCRQKNPETEHFKVEGTHEDPPCVSENYLYINHMTKTIVLMLLEL